MKKIEFNRTVFRDGVPEFEQGKQYDVTAGTLREVRRGNAAEVEVAEREREHVASPTARYKKKR
jgi:hypothetical protein